jgi:hypothetical protein
MAAAAPETSPFSVHWSSSSAACFSCQELGDERHQAGIDLVDWRAALVVSDQQPWRQPVNLRGSANLRVRRVRTLQPGAPIWDHMTYSLYENLEKEPKCKL